MSATAPLPASPTQQGGGRYSKLHKYKFSDFNLHTDAVA